MKAIRFHQYGGPEVLQLDDVPRPVPGTGQVLVEVAGTSFNPVDATIRAGFLQQVFPVGLPHTPGVDVAGTVAALGADVDGFAVGDRVLGFLPMTEPGAAAEFVLAPAAALAAAPTAIPLADAAALPAVGLIAWQLVTEHVKAGPGQRILIHGAGGAVGGYAVQLAVEAGATVVATAGPAHAERVRGYGAEVIGRDAPADGGFDAVINLVAASDADALARLVVDGGIFATSTGTAAGSPTVRSVVAFTRSDPAQLAALVQRIDAGRLSVHIGQRVPLDGLPAVHAAAGLPGKTVIVI
jgi:NADPH:quinone reductase-like Zn-dependent oxidoreductase